MGNLPRAAYANLRMMLNVKSSPKELMKLNTMIALREQSRGVSSSYMSHQGRLAMPHIRHEWLRTRHAY